MAMIVPTVRSLYTCDGVIGFPNQKSDIMGLFNSISPVSYPCVQPAFVVYARLSQGLGQIPFFLELRFAATQQLVHLSNVQQLFFPDRDTLVEMAFTMTNVPFPNPGLYLVELFCNNQWVADTTILLQ